jgi:hypothetical protein
MNCEEIFVPVTDYEDLYTVSNYGNIYSLIKRKMLFPTKTVKGYSRVGLYRDKRAFFKFVHRVVAQHFIPNEDKYSFNQINHKNGIKHDNRVENLEWCTHSENAIHSFRVLKNKNHLQYNHPFKGVFEGDHSRSIFINQYSLDGIFIKRWSSIIEACKYYGVSSSCIVDCCKGRQKTSKGFIWKYD